MIVSARVPSSLHRHPLEEVALALFPDLEGEVLRRVIDWGGCAVNGVCCRTFGSPVAAGDEITLGIMEPERCVELVYTSGDMLYEDDDYLAVQKGSGINSQRTPYQLKGTVEYAVGLYLESRGIREPVRVVHRLDRGTSGVIFFPKNRRSATHISLMLRDGKVEKRYLAVVAGSPDGEEWTLDRPIGKISRFRYGVDPRGKPAFTRFRIVSRGRLGTLVEARPLTGRTHQIRVHLESLGLPIVGDTPYGGAPAERLMLHCRRMAFISREGRVIAAEAPLGDDFLRVMERMGIEWTSNGG